MTQSTVHDIKASLLSDHRAVEAEFDRYDKLTADQRSEYFCALVPVLVAHEVAEEEILYPAIRRVDKQAEAVVDERIAEQSEAEELLKKMEKLDPPSAEFDISFKKLRAAVLEHAQSEEKTVFPLLDQHDGAFDRGRMGELYQKAKDIAPTHPHPHAPDTPPGNLVIGPIAAIADRVRDAIR